MAQLAGQKIGLWWRMRLPHQGERLGPRPGPIDFLGAAHVPIVFAKSLWLSRTLPLASNYLSGPNLRFPSSAIVPNTPPHLGRLRILDAFFYFFYLTSLAGLLSSGCLSSLFSVPAPLFNLLAGSSAGFFSAQREVDAKRGLSF
jgi:hypothetical protein